MLKPQRPYLFRAIYDWILDNQWTPYVLIDTCDEAVRVPKQFVGNSKLVLNLSPAAIHDFVSDEAAIAFSARFSGTSHNIFIPFTAVLALYAQENGMGMLFPDEVFAAPVEAESEAVKEDGKDFKKENKKPGLTVVK